MLPPYELKNVEFSKTMRGYNPAEVDEHIAFIIEKYTELYRENDELERKLKSAYAKLDEIKGEEESIRSAMINAQRASSKIMNEANDRADIIINTARKSCDRILADFRSKIKEEQAILLALNTSVAEFKDKLFKAYNSHIAFIEDIKLVDEEEIKKYALSEDSYTSAVVQNIKNDIINLNNGENKSSEEEEKQDEGFVKADLVTREPVVGTPNVKDTIKELNKRIVGEDGFVTLESFDDTTETIQLAEDEYKALLKQLGVEESVNISEEQSEGEDIFEKPSKRSKNKQKK